MSSYYNFVGDTINMNNVEETMPQQHLQNNNEIPSPDSQKRVCKITKPLSSFLEAVKFNCCGYYLQAKSNLEQALEELEKEKDFEQNNGYLLLKILIELSKANLGLGKYKEAEANLIQGQEKLQRSKTVTTQERELFCAEIEAYFGCVDMEKHLFEAAFKRFSKALLIFQNSKAEKTCQRVMCYRRIGELFLEQKFYGDALEYLNLGINFLTGREDLDNEEFIELMRSLNRKGLLYLNIQRYKEAKEIFFENSRAIKSRFGEQHVELAWIYQNLSTMYLRLCQYKEANTMLESAIVIQTRLFGEKYPGIAKAYLEKGRLLMDQEKLEEGELSIKKGLELASAIYDENEPVIGVYYLKLGYFYLEQEKCAKAEEYFKQLLSVYTKAYGEDNVLTSSAYHALAITYQEMGNEKEAQKNYQKDLEVCRKNYGEYHPEVSKSYYWLGILEWMNDRHDIAIDYFEKCIEMNKKFYGETSPQLSIDYQELARISIDCGRIDEAIEYYKKSNKIEKTYFGKEHPRLVRSYFLTGIGLCDAGKYDEAILVLEKALSIAIDFSSKQGNLQLRRIYHAIGNVYNNQAEYGKALKFYGMALDVWKENEKNEELLRNIGDVFYNQDKFEKALNVYKKALLTAVKNKGYKHYAVGILHTNIGNCLGWMRNEELEALKNLQKGIKILLQVPFKDQVVLLDNFYSRGDVMIRTKGPKEGLAAMKKAIMVCRMSEKGKVQEVDKRIRDFEIRKALNDKNFL